MNNEFPRTATTNWLLKTTEMCSLTVLEMRTPQLRCQFSWLLLEIVRENSFHAPLPSSGGCQ